MFADDTKLIASIRSRFEDQYRAKLQKDIDRVSEWCKRWHMPLNTTQCKVMNIRRMKPGAYWRSLRQKRQAHNNRQLKRPSRRDKERPQTPQPSMQGSLCSWQVFYKIHLCQEIQYSGKGYVSHASDLIWNTEFKYGILALKRT